MYRLLCALRQRIEETKAEREARKDFKIENNGDIPATMTVKDPVQQDQKKDEEQEQ